MGRRQVEQNRLVKENGAMRQIIGEMVLLTGGFKVEILKLIEDGATESDNVKILLESVDAMFKELGIGGVEQTKEEVKNG